MTNNKTTQIVHYSILFVVLCTPFIVSNYFYYNYLTPKQAFFQLSLLIIFYISSWQLNYLAILPRNTLFYLCYAFFGWSFCISIFCAYPAVALAKTIWWLTGLWLILICRYYFSAIYKNKLFTIFLTTVNCVAIVFLIQWCGYNFLPEIRPGFHTSTLGNPNFVGNYVAAMGVALAGYIFSTTGKRRLLLFFNWLFLSFILAMTGSRGALVGSIIGYTFIIILYLLQRPKQPKKIYYIITLIALSILITLIPIYRNTANMWQKEQQSTFKFSHTEERIMMWTSIWRTFAEQPLGYGADINWIKKSWDHKRRFIYQPGNEKYLPESDHRVFYQAHNDYLQMLVEIGVPGLIMFLLIIINMLFLGYNNCKKIEEENAWWISSAHLAAVIMILVQALVSFPLQLAVGYLSFILHWSFVFANKDREIQANRTFHMVVLLVTIPMVCITLGWIIGNLK